MWSALGDCASAASGPAKIAIRNKDERADTALAESALRYPREKHEFFITCSSMHGMRRKDRGPGCEKQLSMPRVRRPVRGGVSVERGCAGVWGCGSELLGEPACAEESSKSECAAVPVAGAADIDDGD